MLARAAELALAAGVDGLRADLVMLRAARALAALQARPQVLPEDVDAVADLALAHRRADAQPEAQAQSPQPAQQPPSQPPSQTAASQGGQASPTGDWGALPPRPAPMVRVVNTGGLAPKKA